MPKPYKTGYVQGTFDMFHVGHLILLERAKARCERLIVGVVSDELNEVYKGARPYISYEDRASIVGAIKYVDEVIKVEVGHDDKLEIWEQHPFDCHFSGDDHMGWEGLIAELRKRGSDVEFFPYTQRVSSTDLKRLMWDKARYGLAADISLEGLPPRVAIYGAGKFGRDLHRKIMESKTTTVAAWVDKSHEGLWAQGIFAEPPERLAATDFDAVLVAVKNPSIVREIVAELHGLGIPMEKIRKYRNERFVALTKEDC